MDKYVHESLVSKTPPADTSWAGRITGTGVRVRKGPGTNYAVIGSTTKGQTVRVYEEKDGWGKVDEGKRVALKYIKREWPERFLQNNNFIEFRAVWGQILPSFSCTENL